MTNFQEYVREVRAESLDVYARSPRRLTSEARGERVRAEGGYSGRQLVELIQNAIDQLEGPEGRVEVALVGRRLYCANSGEPFDLEGIDGITGEYESAKDEGKIGQFGLGFRSLVALSDNVDLLSTSGSFGFDLRANEKALVALGLDPAAGVPLLRIPSERSYSEVASVDEVVAAMREWASTVIRVDLRDDSALQAALAQLETVDPRVLLFSPSLNRLTITVDGRSTETSAERSGNCLILEHGDELTEWTVFERRSYEPSLPAKEDAGLLVRRDHVTLSWALPASGDRRGEIWLYFPTQWSMSLRGLLNAPWKSDDSRLGLLGGIYNEELFAVAAELVVDSLSELASADSPGRGLSALPAPGRLDTATDFDRILVTEIYRIARGRKIAPDVDGELRDPASLRIPPAKAPDAAVERWYASASCDRKGWAHRDSFDDQSRRRLKELEGCEAESLRRWFDWMMEHSTVQASIDALGVVATLGGDGEWTKSFPDEASRLRSLPCVLAADSLSVLALDSQRVFLKSGDSGTPDSMIVHPEVAKNPSAALVLEAFGIRPAGALAAFSAFVESEWDRKSEERWREFWRIASETSVDEFRSVLSRSNIRVLFVKTVSGDFRGVPDVLLPGPVVNRESDPDVAVDVDFHLSTLAHLRAMGVVDLPVKGAERAEPFDWNREEFPVRDTRDEAVRVFMGRRGHSGSFPRDGYARVRDHPTVRPLRIVEELSEQAAAVFTKEVVRLAPAPPNWAAWHATTPGSYPTTHVPAPEVSVLQDHGELDSSLGIHPLRFCVGSGLATADRLLPVTDLDETTSRAYDAPWDWASMSSIVLEHAFELHLASQPPNAVLLALEAARHGASRAARLPATVDGAWGLHPYEEVILAPDPVPISIRALGRPVLVIASSDDRAILEEAWEVEDGAKHSADSFATDFEPSTEAVRLASRFPWLTLELSEAEWELGLVPCTRLETYSVADPDESRVAQRSIRDGDFWYYNSATLDGDELVGALLHDLGRCDLIGRVDELRERFESNFTAARIVAARNAPTDAEKLDILFGRETLESHLGSQVMGRLTSLVGGQVSDIQVAQALLATRGDAVLRPLVAALKGFDAPVHFSGGATASRFVEMLGLAPRYAGAPRKAEPTNEVVPGPPHLPDLHPFQEPLVEDVRQLVGEGGKGILWLPTGAGKTRVAMQGLAAAAKDGSLSYPVLWIAEREELCEQAIESLKSVWAVAGPDAAITVSRLWGGRQVAPVDGPHLVVATIQTLRTAIKSPEYTWLRGFSCIVLDEAHRSINESYQELVGIADRPGAALLGLTATPFRGHDYEQSHKLASQYGFRLIESSDLLPDPIVALRQLGILSQAHHQNIEGATVELSDADLAHLKAFHDPPVELERRLASDTARNRRLLTQILALDPDWAVIVFALSVEHAELLAMALEASGRPSRAISGGTEKFARRSMVEEFRKGKVKVLTNYQVFAEGFDAPETQALVIARPTFSPNLYQQMIGRGLRGKKQGGTEECWIYDVEDNLVRFDRKLAFTHFRGMFKSSDVG